MTASLRLGNFIFPSPGLFSGTQCFCYRCVQNNPSIENGNNDARDSSDHCLVPFFLNYQLQIQVRGERAGF
ncbi:hypothetical protein F4819DRAFT_469165 [Hypoxylon fuscum]|nr:hypothetical protein F4819DRAFT_469165 [Hypoxylon fuscum]